MTLGNRQWYPITHIKRELDRRAREVDPDNAEEPAAIL